MATDVQISGGIGPAPQSYTVPNAQEIIPKVARATFDGTAAATAFLPTIQIISDGGVVIASVPTDTTVAAGGSADVTFAPFLRGPATSGIRNVTAIYDYTLTANATSINTATDGIQAGAFPQTFSILEIWLTVRTDEATTASPINYQVNGDTGANYDRLFFSAFTYNAFPAGTTSIGVTSGANQWQPSAVCAALTGGSYYSLVRFTMPDYTSSTRYKTCESTHSHPDTTIAPAGGTAGLLIAPNLLGWRGTDPVTSFKVFPATGGVNLLAGTRLTVVGI